MSASSSIHFFVTRYVDSLPRLDGKVVVDVPAGNGSASRLFRDKGAEVIALDLFPEFMQPEGISCRYADITEPIPLEDGQADIVICQEGIEHMPDQLALLREFNRILKPGGQLIITAPSISDFRGRFSQTFTGANNWKKLPASEINSVWFSDKSSDRLYFGHVFMIDVQKLRTLAVFSGFEIARRLRTGIRVSAVLYGLLLFVPHLLLNLAATGLSHRKLRAAPAAVRRRVLGEQLRLNLSPITLLCKHIFWVLRKTHEVGEAAAYLKSLTRR